MAMSEADEKAMDEWRKVDHIEIPDELIDAYASIFTKNMRTVMDIAAYLFSGPPTESQYMAALWKLYRDGRDKLEEYWGGPLP